MELTIIAIVGVGAIVAVAAVSRRIEVAAPLCLVVAGIVPSFLPSLPEINVDPKWILAADLLAARAAGSYTSRTLTRAQHALDLQEAAFRRFPDLADPT